MNNENILNRHKYSIYYDSIRCIWCTYIPDYFSQYKRKFISRKLKEDLLEYLADFYNLPESSRISFKETFYLALDDKMKYVKSESRRVSAHNTYLRYDSDYRRYFSDTEFERLSIGSISKKDIDNICFFNLDRYNMRKKAFMSLRGILKLAFDYAFEEYWLNDNTYKRMNFKKFNSMFVDEVPVSLRYHSESELLLILDELHLKQLNAPYITSYWALELQIIAGLRRGEIPPLMWSDVSNGYLSITREQLTYYNDFVIVEHTKTYKDRRFPITDELNDYLIRLRDMQNVYYPDSLYLFPANSKNGVITNRSVYLVYRKICKKFNIDINSDIIKGPHSFRRNAITNMLNKSNGDIYLTSSIYGNSPGVASKNYYTGIDLNYAKEILDNK